MHFFTALEVKRPKSVGRNEGVREAPSPPEALESIPWLLLLLVAAGICSLLSVPLTRPLPCVWALLMYSSFQNILLVNKLL